MSVLIGIVLVCGALIVAACVTLVTLATLVEILPPLFAEESDEDELRRPRSRVFAVTPGASEGRPRSPARPAARRSVEQ